MKLTSLKLGVLAFSLFAYSQTVSAQDAQKKPDPEKMFKGLDADKDGKISLDEFKNKKRKKEIPAERLEAMYAKMDANSDGSVTMEEYKEGLAKGKDKLNAMKKKKAETEDMQEEN